MKKIILQALVEGEEHSVRCEASNVTGIELLTAFSHICEVMIEAEIEPFMLKKAVDFAAIQKHNQDIE